MAFELTREEIKVLDTLSNRWEAEVAKFNYRLLCELYESEQKAKERHPDSRLIEIIKLKDDFVGKERKFKSLWKLINYIGAHLGVGILREVRFVFPKGTVMAIHMLGCEKSLVLSFKRGAKSWFYKEYATQRAFMEEIEDREGAIAKESEIRYAKFFAKKPERTGAGGITIRQPFVKEEYGGIAVNKLEKMVRTREEAEIMVKISNALPHAYTDNYAYNKETKTIIKIDHF